jgi:hypothetical protein
MFEKRLEKAQEELLLDRRIHQENKQKILQFMKHLKSKGRCEPTQRKYLIRLTSLYRTADLKTRVALETGTYTLKVRMLGYIQKKDTSVYAARSQQVDTKRSWCWNWPQNSKVQIFSHQISQY